MSRAVNKVILIGNVGQDPDIKFTNDGKPIANLSLATTESWKDKATGERKDATEWHRIVVFGNIAKVVQDYVKKGALLYVEGKLKTKKWQDKNGQDRYTTSVEVSGFGTTLQMLDRRDSPPTAQPAPVQAQVAVDDLPIDGLNNIPF